MRNIIMEVISEVMDQNRDLITEDTVIKNIPGFDSLQFVMMISRFKEEYNIDIPLDRALEVETIGDLIKCAIQK